MTWQDDTATLGLDGRNSHQTKVKAKSVPCAMQQKNPEQIDVVAWRTAIRQETFANYHYEMGVALERNGAPNEAEASFRRAIEAMPHHSFAYWRLIALLEAQGKPEQAAAVRTQATQFCPNYEKEWAEEQVVLVAQQAINAQDPDSAAALMQKLDWRSMRRAALWAELAGLYRRQGKIEQAVDCIATAAALDLLEVRREQGLLAWAQKRTDDAVSLLEPVLSETPYDLEAAGHLAWSHLVRIEFDRALAVTTNYCREPTGNVLLDWGHALALHVLGRYDEAIAFLQSMPLVRDPQNRDRWGLLCYIGLAHQAAGRIQEALAFYREAVATSGTDIFKAAARSYLGLGLQAAGDLNGALDQHRAATEGFSACAWVLSNHALCLLALGEKAQAQALFVQSRSCPDAWHIPLQKHQRPWASDLLKDQ